MKKTIPLNKERAIKQEAQVWKTLDLLHEDGVLSMVQRIEMQESKINMAVPNLYLITKTKMAISVSEHTGFRTFVPRG